MLEIYTQYGGNVRHSCFIEIWVVLWVTPIKLFSSSDKPELVVVNDRTPVPRRAKKDFFLRAFNALGTWDSFDLEWVPFNLRDWLSQDVTTDDGIVVRKTTLPRPSFWSRSRFNEYKYTTTQTINTIAYSLETFAYISATSHTRYKGNHSL